MCVLRPRQILDGVGEVGLEAGSGIDLDLDSFA
jgi:hypothetical protein